MAKEDERPADPGDGDTAPGGGSGATAAGGRRRASEGDNERPPLTRAAARKAAADEQQRAEARRARTGATAVAKAKGSERAGGADKTGARGGRTATPAKTPIQGTSKTAAKTGARPSAPTKPGSRAASKTATKPTPKAAARSGNPKRSAAAVSESSRYTAPVPRSMKISPWYVPAAMFAFLGLGMLVIFLNYIGFPFGDPSNIRLFIGLGLILLGIITATQYH